MIGSTHGIKFNKKPPTKEINIKIIISSKKHNLSLRGAREIKSRLSEIKQLEVLGPVDSPLLKVRKYYRTRLLLRFNSKLLLQKRLKKLLNTI